MNNEVQIDTDNQSYIEISTDERTIFVNNFDDDVCYIEFAIRKKLVDNSQVARLDIIYSDDENNIYLEFPSKQIDYAKECYKIIKKILVFREKNKKSE